VQNFYRSFAREKDGAWVCIEPTELELPGGRIQVAVGTRFIRGARYMGLDIAGLLDEHHERVRPRP
jgi:hypothetical protein